MWFFEGRDICENLRRALKMIDCANKNIKAGVIICLDFEKCFNKCVHAAVLKSMEFFGLSTKFTSWISMFFKKFMAMNQNLGFISDFFAKTRGINPCCNISPVCYVTMGELISIKIKENHLIKRMNLESNICNILSQFAGDTALFLQFEKVSL